MNKDQLRKSVGQVVRLRPPAQDIAGRACDDRWLVQATDAALTLCNQRTNQIATLGYDHVIKYTTDPANSVDGTLAAFLNVGVSVRIGPDRIDVEPFLTPGVGAEMVDVARLNPLVVREGSTERLFSWRGRGPVHTIAAEEPPRQLFEFFRDLCAAIRTDTEFEPEFNLPSEIRGEIVYEFSPDGRARWQVLGGMNGAAASQVLVVRPRT